MVTRVAPRAAGGRATELSGCGQRPAAEARGSQPARASAPEASGGVAPANAPKGERRAGAGVAAGDEAPDRNAMAWPIVGGVAGRWPSMAASTLAPSVASRIPARISGVSGEVAAMIAHGAFGPGADVAVTTAALPCSEPTPGARKPQGFIGLGIMFRYVTSLICLSVRRSEVKVCDRNI